MAKPLLATDNIYDTALRLLEKDGVEALTARNLAAALKCSTRTLYQQVGKRDELIGDLVAHYIAGVKLNFREEAKWQDSTRSWAENLRSALLAHPNLSRLMSEEHRGPIAEYVKQLFKVMLRDGFHEELALRSCRVLANIIISLSLSEIIAPPDSGRHKRHSRKKIDFEVLAITRRSKKSSDGRAPEVFENAINWVITGIESELI